MYMQSIFMGDGCLEHGKWPGSLLKRNMRISVFFFARTSFEQNWWSDFTRKIIPEQNNEGTLFNHMF